MEIRTNNPMLLLEPGELGRHFNRLTDLETAAQKRSATPGAAVVSVCTWDSLAWRWHFHGWACLPPGEWEHLPREADAARVRVLRIAEAQASAQHANQ